jgi:predicted Fe-S protein YdhL (DUF1289 family)
MSTFTVTRTMSSSDGFHHDRIRLTDRMIWGVYNSTLKKQVMRRLRHKDAMRLMDLLNERHRRSDDQRKRFNRYRRPNTAKPNLALDRRTRSVGT